MTTFKTSFARAAMLLLLAVFTSIKAGAQSTDPIVTGYFPIGGTPGNYDSHTFTMLVDGDRTTKWCITNQPISQKFYIEFYSLEAFVPTGYILTTGDDNVTCPNRNPKSWNIMARPSLSDTWTTIATVTNDNVLQDVNTTDFEFTIDNSTVYKYFRFEVTAVVGSGTNPTFQLGEFRFRGHEEVIEPEVVTVDLSTLTGNYTAQDGEVLTGTLGGNYKISIADGATVTLNGIAINGVDDGNSRWAGITCVGDATIVLESGTTNTVKGFADSGIYVSNNKTLRIRGDGQLNVSAHDQKCGIGVQGNLIIESGIITATGGQLAAGIGSPFYLNYAGSTITINGGTVTAIGGSNAAGIGTGASANGACGNITISGGTVNATGGYAAAGIGSGDSNTCGTITISGGTVTANGGSYGAGIGSGSRGSCGDITITNGVNSVIATKDSYSSRSIGAGNGGTCGTITIGGIVYSNGIATSPYTFVPERDISLTEGTAYIYDEDYPVTSATYTRTIGSERIGKHQAWFVPFDYTITSADTEKFKFYKINMIANSATPSQDATDDIWVFLKPIGAGDVLHGNMPYVYKPLDDMESYSFTSNNVTLKAKNNDVLLNMETAEDIYSVYGIYENTSPSASDPFYYINYYGGISLGNSNSVTVGPYRWIIRKESKFGGTTSYAPAMRFFDGEEDDDPTGIVSPLGETEEGAAWFDLNGRKLSGKPSQKGIYIRNGRKEAIR